MNPSSATAKKKLTSIKFFNPNSKLNTTSNSQSIAQHWKYPNNCYPFNPKATISNSKQNPAICTSIVDPKISPKAPAIFGILLEPLPLSPILAIRPTPKRSKTPKPHFRTPKKKTPPNHQFQLSSSSAGTGPRSTVRPATSLPPTVTHSPHFNPHHSLLFLFHH